MNHRHRFAQSNGWRVVVSSGRLSASGRRLKQLALLLGVLLVPGTPALHSQVTVDLYTAEHEKSPKVDQFYAEKFREQAREEQEKFRPRIAIPDAVGEDVPTLVAMEAAAREVNVVRSSTGLPFWLIALLLLGVAGLVVLLVVLRLCPDMAERLAERVAPWNPLRDDAETSPADVRVEALDFAEFVAAFRTGPAPRSVTDSPAPPLETFMAGWPRMLADLRKLLQEVSATPDSRMRRRNLRDLGRELRVVKGETGLPELLPVWQMVCGLEGLVKQLAEKVNEVTPSTLRTLSGGLDLLAELCRPGLDAQLLTRRPIRLLAVDDDPISRHAISFALKRTLHAPDLASAGDAGLALAQEHAYDVIFLDVEMPGMDGFELCSQIRKSALNAVTPIVFVTGHSDFEARVQSSLSGGCDLIAKPFLTFELAVKALTLAMQRRRKEAAVAKKPDEAVVVASVAANASQRPSSVLAEEVAAVETRAGSDHAVPLESVVAAATGAAPAAGSMGGEFTSPPALDSKEIATEFLLRAPEHLNWVKELLQSALKQTDEAAWLPMLADVYLRLHSFTPDEKFAKGHPVMQLSSALERLLRKLLQEPTPPSKATMLTVTAAVELLRELCATASPVVPVAAPVHLLVVDDDPVARRALTGVLQTTFAKPACAETGPAALALAAQQKFDAIFLDVQMPGMDGFEVFARLRSGGNNTETPVVFVCGRSDFGSAVDVNAQGNCDIIAKPFLAGELLVKVLTLMLRQQHQSVAAV
jgi:DNA-binding response OmpR family regulator